MNFILHSKNKLVIFHSPVFPFPENCFPGRIKKPPGAKRGEDGGDSRSAPAAARHKKTPYTDSSSIYNAVERTRTALFPLYKTTKQRYNGIRSVLMIQLRMEGVSPCAGGGWWCTFPCAALIVPYSQIIPLFAVKSRKNPDLYFARKRGAGRVRARPPFSLRAVMPILPASGPAP